MIVLKNINIQHIHIYCIYSIAYIVSIQGQALLITTLCSFLQQTLYSISLTLSLVLFHSTLKTEAILFTYWVFMLSYFLNLCRTSWVTKLQRTPKSCALSFAVLCIYRKHKFCLRGRKLWHLSYLTNLYILRLLLISSLARTWFLALRCNHANNFHRYCVSAVFPKVLTLNMSRGQWCGQFALFSFWENWLEVNLLIKLPPKKQNINYLEEMFLRKKDKPHRF